MPTTHAPRATRRDSLRNQQLVLSAARDVLAEHGTEASMELIAARAGVGVGTVYRHFPNKDALVNALIVVIVEELSTAAITATTHGGSGLEEFLRILGRSFATHRGYARMLIGNAHTGNSARADSATTRGTNELRSMIAQLVRQARNSGRIDSSVTLGDIMTLIWALRGIVETSAAVAPDAWERHLDIHLAALRGPKLPTTRPAVNGKQLAAIASQQP